MKLDSRKKKVLQAIVEDYIATAEPVGSRTIARKYNLGVSPATIRNEMADLEEMGYLEQPHTSAGRIPSDLGYRFYVDCLMAPCDHSSIDHESIASAYRRKVREIESLIQMTVRVLSESTNCLAVVLGPQFGLARVQYLQFFPLFSHQALMVLVTDTGLAENRLIEIPEGTQPGELLHVGQVLNRTLAGLTLDEVSSTAWRELSSELARYRSIVEQVTELLEALTAQDGAERVYMAGTINILTQPEFRDIDKARMLLGLLEKNQALYHLLKPKTHDLSISIGEENQMVEVRDCSLVSSAYHIGQSTHGHLAVMGPRRMDYSRIVSVVQIVEGVFSETLRKNVG